VFPDIGLAKNKFPVLPRYYWFGPQHRRRFFEDFAKAKGFDPLVPKNWYTVSIDTILQTKGGERVMLFYGRSLNRALLHLFPEIELEKQKVPTHIRAYWSEESRRRKFFVSFAREKGFDPLIAANWYRVTRDEVLAAKGGQSVMAYHNASFVDALYDLFPDIKIEKTKFSFVPYNYWANVANRKRLFEQFAKERGFDPLIPDNWYGIKGKDLHTMKGGGRVLSYYNWNFVKAVTTLFPDIGFDRAKFPEQPKGYWKDEGNRKNFFYHLAKQRGFDPLIATSWYSIDHTTVLSCLGGKQVISYYEYNFVKALTTLFPDIGFDRAKFSVQPRARKVLES